PGAELKEALLPDEMAVFNLQLSERISSQFLYLFKWHDTRPEPAGSYFSTNDFGVPGGQRVLLGFGAFSDQGVDFRPLGGPLNAVGAAAQALAAGLPFAAAVATGTAVGTQRAAQNGGNLSAVVAQQYATIGANTLLAGGDVTAQATNIATHEYAKTAGYFEEF